MSTTPLTHWMAWEGGVDLAAFTKPGLTFPNVIIHVARLVHTPVGSAAAGMVFYQPDPAQPPSLMGFISTDPDGVGRYFGPAIFASTPFEAAPSLPARIDVETHPDHVAAMVVVGGLVFRTRLANLAPLALVQRAPAPMTPFTQQGLEAAATEAKLWVNDREIPLIVPPVGLSGGAAAVFAPTGLYAR